MGMMTTGARKDTRIQRAQEKLTAARGRVQSAQRELELVQKDLDEFRNEKVQRFNSGQQIKPVAYDVQRFVDLRGAQGYLDACVEWMREDVRCAEMRLFEVRRDAPDHEEAA